ncbi:DUF2306 domain-containing protein [Streptomyces sp. CAU 1734]|uniref:DUF2306 domain-containing protein n=1 Tax=Streptomyces sp. CAU 1734 TaxID=3140360 RepID=UPI003260D369
MTQNADPAELTDRRSRPAPAAPAPVPIPVPAPAAQRSWLRRPWILPLGLLVAGFLYMTWPRYLGLDPSQSLIPLDPGFTSHYAFLVLHIVFGTIAIVTAVLQVWPWLRRNHPAVHRFSGRAYVIGGMVPAALLALVIMPFGNLTGLGAVGTTLWAIGALAVTIAGHRAARARRWETHRTLMVYSFALCMGPVTGRALFHSVWYGTSLIPDFNYALLPVLAQFAGFWLNWIITALAAYWWLRRTSARRRGAAAPAR